MRNCIKLLSVVLCTTALLVSGDPKLKSSGRDTRLNGRFKSATGNWCAWTEVLSDSENTVVSVACHCMSQSGQRIAYTCQYVSQGEKLRQCKASRHMDKDVYDDIGRLLSKTGDGCEHDELNLDELNSNGEQICPGVLVTRKNSYYPSGPCATHDEL